MKLLSKLLFAPLPFFGRSKPGKRDPVLRVLFGALVGFIAADLLRGGPFALLGFVEALKGVWYGASGESGEPLDWLTILGLPGAIAGALVAWLREYYFAKACAPTQLGSRT